MSAKARYHDFCRTAPDLPVFAQDWYLDACSTGGAWDVVLVIENDQVVASLPYFYKQKGPFRYAVMPLYVKWLGPYLLPEFRGQLPREHELLKALIDQLPAFAAFKQAFYPTVTNWLPFYWQQFQQTTHYTYRLNGIQDLAAVQAGFTRNVRRDVGQASRKVRVVDDLGAEVFYQINEKTFARQGLPMPHSRQQFVSHATALIQHQAGHFLFAVDEQNRVHSAVFVTWDRTTAYYHLAGDDPALRRSSAGLLLVWEAIRYASEVLKLDCFDFEGSMMPSIEQMRTRFGAVQVPYFLVWKYDSRWFRLLEQLRGR